MLGPPQANLPVRARAARLYKSADLVITANFALACSDENLCLAPAF
jgi:hypothetical protein